MELIACIHRWSKMAIQQHEESFPHSLPIAEGNRILLGAEYATVLELPSHITEYSISKLERISLKVPEVTTTGAHIYQELCTFYDSNGHKVVREATIAIPNSNLVEVIPYPVISSDAWTTGVRGLNRIQIKELVDMGFPVVWLHHADQRSPLQRNKSITRSARQSHALLDDLAGNADFSVLEVLGDGYSRGGMTEEKFIALAAAHKRKVLFSILTAPAFATDMSLREKIEAMTEQLPQEIKGIGSIALRHAKRAIEQRSLTDLNEFRKTPNFHPKNIVQEAMWIPALVNANVGPMIAQQPRDTAGIRNFLNHDNISQQAIYVDLYAPHPNTVVVGHDGAHVEGASPEFLYEVRKSQFSQLGRAILRGEALNAELIAQRAELELLEIRKRK